jgi:hypothetical protein
LWWIFVILWKIFWNFGIFIMDSLFIEKHLPFFFLDFKSHHNYPQHEIVLNFFLFFYFEYFQLLLNTLMDDHHIINITKLKKNHIMSNQSFFLYKIMHTPKISTKECFKRNILPHLLFIKKLTKLGEKLINKFTILLLEF